MESLSRRQFVASACAAALGSDPCAAAPAAPHVGIEVYSLFQPIRKDPGATLKQVAAIGYKTIELATFVNFGSPGEVRKMLDDAGLVCPSLQMTQEPVQKTIDAAKILGAKYLVAGACWKKDIPATPAADVFAILNSLTLDDYKWNADRFNRNGEAAKNAGLTFAFHNHNFDFKKLEGIVAYDELLRLTNKDFVKLELDCGWMIVAGFSPAEYLRKYCSRYQLLHIRDFQAGFPHSLKLGPAEMALSTPLGEGSIDYRPIFAAAKKAGIREYFVEQEPTLKAPLADSLKTDYDYLNRRLAG